MRQRTSEQLARAWKEGRLGTETALKRHLKRIGVGPVHPGLLFLLPIVLSYANMGLMDKVIPLGTDEHGQDVERTVAQIVEDLELEPFLNEPKEAK